MKLLKYPKYLFLGMYIDFKRDTESFFVGLITRGLVFGVPFLSPILYFALPLPPSVGLAIFLSVLLSIVAWWGLAIVLLLTFVVVPKSLVVLKDYVRKGEEEEYRIFQILKDKKQ